MTAEKKKFESRFGKIEINKEHSWSYSDGFQVTPYLKELSLYAGQEDNFQSASEGLLKYLRIGISSTQIDRMVKYYGAAFENQEAYQLSSQSSTSLREGINALSAQAKTYVMMDGCMLLTRQKGEWKEMKLGRIFNSDIHYQLNDNRKWIKESLYVAHFGHYEPFLDKLEPIVDEYESLKERLVFVNDGAKWIWKWVEENYPHAVQILDFFHAVEYLGDFAKLMFRDKSKCSDWISRQKLMLLNDEVEKVIIEVSKMDCLTEEKKKGQSKLLTYYSNNKARMKYKTYRDEGLLIGSGPIESAHRTVIQKRLKQSGQRWTQKGAQCVANLRVAHKSGEWTKVIKLIENVA